MSIRTTFRLLFAVCILGFIIVIIETREKSKTAAGADQQELLSFDAEDVDKIVIERKDLVVECIRKDGGWFINLPIRAKADSTRIRRILGVLDSLRQYEVVTQKEMNERELTLADYGLKEPAARMLVQGRRTNYEILIGDQVELGGKICIRLNGSNDVMVTSMDIMDIIPAKAGDLRDRTIFRGELEQLVRLQIKRPGSFIEVVLRDNGWFISHPMDVPADERRVRAMLSGLLKCRIVRFVRDGGVADAAKDAASAMVNVDQNTIFAPYGLGQDEASSIVTVWFSGDDVGHDVIIGKTTADVEGEAYARFAEVESVFTVPAELAGSLGVTVDDLRSRNILPHKRSEICGLALEANDRKVVLARKPAGGWNIIEPIRAKGDDDVIDKLLNSITGLRISAFTDTNKTAVSMFPIEKPRLVLRSSTNATYITARFAAESSTNAGAIGSTTAEVAEWYSVTVGGNVPGADMAYIQCGTNAALFEVESSVIDPMLIDPCNPLAYMDRQMLSLDPTDIIKLTLTRNGIPQTVERDATGSWIVSGVNATNVNAGAGYVVNTKVVDDVLLALTNVRAERIESTEPSNPSAYGFDASETLLSAVLKGDKALQKTLILGFKAGTDGVYAMLRGTDVLFVLDYLSVKVLTRSLISQEQPLKSETPRP